MPKYFYFFSLIILFCFFIFQVWKFIIIFTVIFLFWLHWRLKNSCDVRQEKQRNIYKLYVCCRTGIAGKLTERQTNHFLYPPLSIHLGRSQKTKKINKYKKVYSEKKERVRVCVCARVIFPVRLLLSILVAN